MAYIGKSPVIGNFVKLDAITAVNGQAAYTMQNGGSNFTDYESVNQFLVSLNGTIQAPTDSFTVSGSTLTFASNLSTGDVIDFIMVFGNSLSAGTPTDATVTTAKLAGDAVTEAKIADGAVESEHLNNNIISGQTELASEPADTDEFLVSDAGTLKRIDYSLIKGGAGLVKLSSQTVSSGVSSVDFLSSFSSTYDNYILYYSDLGVATDNVALRIRCASSTGTISGNDYIWGQSESRSNNGPTGDYSTSNDFYKLNYTGMGNASTESASGEIIFFGTQDTTHHKMIKSVNNGMSNGSDAIGTRTAGSCKTTSALVGFTIYASSGNIDSGKFTLFGVTK